MKLPATGGVRKGNRATIAFAVMVLWCFCGCNSSPEPAGSSLPSAPAQASQGADNEAIPADRRPPTSREDSAKNAAAAIDAWLKLLDEGQYGRCWEQSSNWLKQQGSKDT